MSDLPEMTHSVERTERLAADDVAEIRRLLDDAFDGQFAASDWQHALGGHHVVVRSSGLVVAHAAVVRRLLRVDGDVYDVGYVEAVATLVDRQGAGFGTHAMLEAARIIDDHHELGVLSTSSHGFYERLGWRPWRGPSWVRRSNGTRVRTRDDDDGLMFLVPTDMPPPDPTRDIECRARNGDDW